MRNTLRPHGDRLLRDRLLAAHNLRPVTVAYFEWDNLPTSGKQALLARKLGCVYSTFGALHNAFTVVIPRRQADPHSGTSTFGSLS